MEDEDYLELIGVMEGQLKRYGFDEIADLTNFVDESDPSDERPTRFLAPKEHLIALLDAFDIQLMLRDQNVVRKSLTLIGNVCEELGPESVVVILPEPGERVYLLESLEDLSNLRGELRGLIAHLRNTPRGGEPGTERQ